jgi:hypothetical protein
LCAETIKAVAKVCPFCQAPQAGFARYKHYLIPLLSALMLLAFIGFLCVWLAPDTFRSEARSFARHRNDLVVARASLEREPIKAEFWLGGYITNTGNYPWRVEELEARFLKDRGNLVDVYHAKLSEKFVIQPRQEQAFRVRLGRLAFTNSDVVTQVRVQIATDGNLPPKPD